MFFFIFNEKDIANERYRFFILLILFVKFYYSYAACPSLSSTVSTNIACKFNNEDLENCITPIEETIACLSCNQFYEESTIEKNPCRSCINGSWNASMPNCYPICGKSNEEDLDSGSLLKYPWHVGIYNKQRLVSSGTLIAMNIVLTGASNFIKYKESAGENDVIVDLIVASGKNYPLYFDERDKFSQYSKVDKIDVSAKYNLTNYANDIAILVLEKPFLASQVVQPVCIDFQSEFDHALLPEYGLIAHWIFTYWSSSPFGILVPKVLQEISVKFTPCGACGKNNFQFNNKFPSGVTECILMNIENCHNRIEGGAVVYKNLLNERYYITGTTSIQHCHFFRNCYLYSSIDVHLNFLEHYITNNVINRYCELPTVSQNGQYVFMNRSVELAHKPGYPVLPLTELSLICNSGYTYNSSNETYFTCLRNGQWTPTLGDCTRVSKLEDNTADFMKLMSINIILTVTVIILFVVSIVAVILLKLKYNKKKDLRRELKRAGLDYFKYGNLKRYNPQLGIHNQAELLPYNNNYEFPRDKLELGQQLGSGAFGIVLKADAFGIISNEEKTTVAVKTVKSIVDDIQMKALVSELKIMIHLGQHLNVVNLLGACTENILKRELLVIVEYCRFGNLYDYLLQNRSNYIDQIDSLTGNIDYSFGLKDFKSVPMVYNNSSSSDELDLNNFSSLNSIENGVLKLDDNHPDSHKLLYTKDLISWSFQIARGMEYLASRMIFHGDLAARNILLAENNIVKICDFGLAKRIYRTTNYKKNKDSPLPIKWMAIESIRDQIFSTNSDVWSYGIVLWELFSLAQTPYPGMEPDDKLYQKLLTGYRMESPSYAPKKIYKIMCDCWNIEPLSRPCFNQLAGTVGLLLEENIRQFYIDLSDPYFVINTQRLSKGQKDYLALLSAPVAIDTPKYLSVKSTDLAGHQDESISENQHGMTILDNIRDNYRK